MVAVVGVIFSDCVILQQYDAERKVVEGQGSGTNYVTPTELEDRRLG